MTSEEIAAALGISLQYVYVLRKKGVLKGQSEIDPETGRHHITWDQASVKAAMAGGYKRTRRGRVHWKRKGELKIAKARRLFLQGKTAYEVAAYCDISIDQADAIDRERRTTFAEREQIRRMREEEARVKEYRKRKEKEEQRAKRHRERLELAKATPPAQTILQVNVPPAKAAGT